MQTTQLMLTGTPKFHDFQDSVDYLIQQGVIACRSSKIRALRNDPDERAGWLY